MTMKKKTITEEKHGLVFCVYPEQYRIFDYRVNRPICHQRMKNGQIEGSMVLQEMDKIKVKRNELDYFCLNNIAVLLSISNNAIKEAKDIFDNNIDFSKIKHSYQDSKGDRKKFFIQKTAIVCNYIERIQIGIVFAYTALETFSNLSIPEGYLYSKKDQRKNVLETYDKEAIERWIPLKEKLSKILPDIYKTKSIEKSKFWNHFLNMENYRNDIIHQKSINGTDFYKKYFKKKVFKINESAEGIIKFFYREYSKKNKTNPIWPWIINEKNEIPINREFNSQNFEVIGNIYEGITKKK